MKDEKKQIESPDVEVVPGMAEGVREETPVIPPPVDEGNYFIVTYPEERHDFWTREIPGDISEKELFDKYIRKTSLTPPFRIYKGWEIKIRR